MLLKISHRTVYSYDKPVTYGLQELRLTPKDRPSQQVRSWSVNVTGGTKELEFSDQHQNHVLVISFDGEGHEIEILCEGEVEVFDTSGIVGKHTGCAALWYFQTVTPLTRAGNHTRKLTGGLLADYDDPIARLHALSERIH